jgi:hypothetical protein
MSQLDIQTILEAAGVTWKRGYMVCPKCGEPKLTASHNPAKVVATCWSCHATFKRRGASSRERGCWGSSLIASIWEQCRRALPESPAMNWLVETRMVKLLCDAAAIISTNSIPGSTEALAQRMLLINTLPRQTDRAEKSYKSQGAKLVPEFMKQRNAIWTELVGNLASINRTVNKMPIRDVSLRMADFGSFMASVAHVEGWGTEADQMLDELQGRQTEQAVKSNRIIALIRERFAMSKAYSGHADTAKGWAHILLPLVPDNDLETKKQMTSNFLTWAFDNVQTVKDAFRIIREWHSHRKVWLYTLHAEEGVVARDAHGPVDLCPELCKGKAA